MLDQRLNSLGLPKPPSETRVVVAMSGGGTRAAAMDRAADLLARGDSVVGTDSVAGGIPAGATVCAGDLGDPAIRAAALAGGLDALIHLATVPGGAADADPVAHRPTVIEHVVEPAGGRIDNDRARLVAA